MIVLRRLLALALLVGLTGTAAFGWGNATHTYIVKQIGGVPGYLNLNAMYGAVLPDALNYWFSVEGQTLAGHLHQNPFPFLAAAGAYGQQALGLGFFSHWDGAVVEGQFIGCADFTAHHRGITGGQTEGWIIAKGIQIAPAFAAELTRILHKAGVGNEDMPAAVEILAPQLGHDLAETAVDLMIRRNEDPLVGKEILMAALQRPPETGQLLAEAYAGPASDLGVPASALVALEAEYQGQMVKYGQAFQLPEPATIRTLSVSTARIAPTFIAFVLQYYNSQVPPEAAIEFDPSKIVVTPAQVAAFIDVAIGAVKDDYAAEIAATIVQVQAVMEMLGAPTPSPTWALVKESELYLEGAPLPEAAPTSFALLANYPNPFNPATTIGYALPAQSQVRIAVYNTLGQEVAVLVDGPQSAGSHAVRWDATGRPSGVYFVRMVAGDFSATRPVVLAK